MGRFTFLAPLRIELENGQVYVGEIAITNKTDKEVLFKVRTSTTSKPNMMVKPNMGLLLPYSKTVITVHIRAEAQVHFQITTAFYPRETFLRNEIRLTNFNDAWAFLANDDVDKDVLKFKVSENGEPVFGLCLKDGSEATLISRKDEADLERCNDLRKLIESEDNASLSDMLQSAMDTISELEQIKASQNEEIESLVRRVESLKRITGPMLDAENSFRQNQDKGHVIPFYQTMMLASAGVIILNIMYNAVIPMIYP